MQFKEHDTVERICRALIEVVESNLDKDLIEHSWRKSAFKVKTTGNTGMCRIFSSMIVKLIFFFQSCFLPMLCVT